MVITTKGALGPRSPAQQQQLGSPFTDDSHPLTAKPINLTGGHPLNLTGMPSAATTAAAQAARARYAPAVPYHPPTGGGPGTTQPLAKLRPPYYAAEGIKGVTLKLPPGVPAPSSQHAVEASSVEQQKIDNLKQQVELLEAELRTYREAGGGSQPAGGHGALVPAGQAPSSKREQELEERADELRKEALSAKLRERRAVEEMAEAKELLSEQRAKFTATRKELTAEVIEYQREMDELASGKRAIEADLADAQAALREREEFVHGFDGQMKLLQSQLQEREEERERAARDGEQLRVELNEERVAHAAVRERFEQLRAHQGQLEQMRAAHAEEAEKATAELRMSKLALEAEQHARQKADEDKAYLVKEAATLEATMQGLASTADFIQQENARLKREQATGRVAKVVGRFMVRKMRDKLVAAQASERSMRESQQALHTRFVQAEQKCAAIEREMMVSRRHQAERDAAYEQQKADASELSVENRMLLDRTEQMLADGQRYVAKLEQAEARCVELAAELEVVRQRAELERALRALRPEDLAAVSRVNSALAESIQSLLPRLDVAHAVSDSPATATGGYHP